MSSWAWNSVSFLGFEPIGKWGLCSRTAETFPKQHQNQKLIWTEETPTTTCKHLLGMWRKLCGKYTLLVIAPFPFSNYFPSHFLFCFSLLRTYKFKKWSSHLHIKEKNRVKIRRRRRRRLIFVFVFVFVFVFFWGGDHFGAILVGDVLVPVME